MNVAQERPRSWTPHIILFSVVLHAVLIYYIASAFNFVPPVELPTLSEPTPVFKFNPKVPDLQPEKVEREPRFRPRPTLAPVQPQVDPIPMTSAPDVDSLAICGVIGIGSTCG